MKSTNDFIVRFILRCTNGIASDAAIFARITVDKKRAEFSINQSLNPVFWDADKQEARGSRELVKKINPQLEEVKTKIISCYQQLQSPNAPFTAQAI